MNVDNEIIRSLRAGTIDEDRLAHYLMENFTVVQLARVLNKTVIEEVTAKI